MMSMGADTAVRRAVLVSPPPGVSGALATGVGRALQRLPDALLRAMVRGLRAHADELSPGVLFRNQRSGGCAVGVTLRELAPEAFDFGLVRFWIWQRWRRGVERDVARRFPGLKELQWHFDEAVTELTEAGYPQPAAAVGRWFAASAHAELRSRGSSDAEPRSLTIRTARRTHRRAGGPTRIRGHEAETGETRPEASRWS
jgi:hypothetical protein